MTAIGGLEINTHVASGRALRRPRLSDLPRLAGAVAIGVASVALLGWVIGSEPLKAIFPGHVAMKPNTLVSFVALGGALILVESRDAGRRRAAMILAALVAGFAFVIGLQYVVGANFGLDTALLPEPPAAAGTVHPGRMSPFTVVCFVALGAALMLSRVRAARRVVVLLSGVVVALAGLNLLDFLYGAATPTFLAQYTQMAINTAMLFVLTGIAVPALLPGTGPYAILRGQDRAAALVRRLLVASILIPIVLTELRLRGERAGIYGTAYGATLLTVGTIGLLVIVVWHSGRELRAAHSRLREQALYDPLTGLPNRLLLNDRLERALVRWNRSGMRPGVLFVDLDDFKSINDSFGHSTGDNALRAVATRLRAAIRESDTIARFGGDEFVLLAEEARNREAVASLAARVTRALEQPIEVDGQLILVQGSVGGVIARRGESADEVIGRADRAMYHAKENGKGRFEFEAAPVAVGRPQRRKSARTRIAPAVR